MDQSVLDNNGAKILSLEDLARSPGVSIIALVDSLIRQAHALRSSDIHIDPRPGELAVRLRIDGMLQDKFSFEKRIHPEIISRIKIMSSLRTDEHQVAQDGRFRALLEGGTPVDVRVSITPTYYGENAVLRLLADNEADFTLESLGFTEENQKKLMRAIHLLLLRDMKFHVMEMAVIWSALQTQTKPAPLTSARISV